MAKDLEEDKTVPVYNPDGSISGYTTPKKAAELGIISGPVSNNPSEGLVTGDDGVPLPPMLGGNATREDLEKAGLWEDWAEFYGQSFGGGGVGEDNAFYDYTGTGGGTLALGGSQPGIQPRPPASGGGTPPPGGGTPPPGGSTRPDLPQPPGGEILPGDRTPVDTSWDWDAFVPKQEGDGAWGGYDTDYQAFERYQPGMDSPWGMPNIEGGNRDFYQQQFVNMLRDEQGYRNRQRDAQQRRQDALENPREAPKMDWSWAYGGKGLPEVRTGGEPGSGSEGGLNPLFSTDSTNYEILQQLIGQKQHTGREKAWLDEWAAASDNWGDNTGWANAGSREELMKFIPQNLTGRNRGLVEDIFRNVYQTGTEASAGDPFAAPPGYASPINW